jgi:hypothetical protein
LPELGNSEPATRPKTLSSNKIFKGIVSLPRPLNIFEVSRAMAHVMDPELWEIVHVLTLMFKRYLTVRDLQLRLFVIAEQLGEGCPKEKSRGSLLEWLHINWLQEKL